MGAGWEGSPRGREHMCIYIADSLHLQQKCTHHHNFVKHLHSNKERKKDRKIVAVFNCREICRHVIPYTNKREEAEKV